ncbi:MAG TPA: hypothetical protein VIW94_09740 [Acidimicrobiia bacterium]
MATPEEIKDLARLLGAAGRAHHEVFGGPNQGWAEWYAAFLIDNDLESRIGFKPDLDRVVGWLEAADEQHRVEASEERWPDYYAELFFSRTENLDR